MSLSTPILWVLLPIIVAAITGVFNKKKVLGIILTSLTAFGLSLLAVFFPEDLTLSIGPLGLVFDESLGILGRQISVVYEMLPFIAFIYAMTGLWVLTSGFPGIPITFRPLGLVITALLTAAMGVEPFLYAALLIQTAFLATIPMLSPSGKAANAGILRLLILETIAMPLILLAGWLLSGVETLPPESPLVGQTTLILGLGFALWLSVFPFHSWVPMVSGHSPPHVFSFLMFITPTTILVFGLNFFDRYTFLRTLPNLADIMKLSGILMIVVGGLWTAFQSNLKRTFGFSVLTETGFSLLAIGHMQVGGLNWMLMLFPARALGFWLWGYVLTAIENRSGVLDLQVIQGFARQYPFLSAGLLIAQLSVAGLPLLGSFPIKGVLLTATFLNSTVLGMWGFIGNLGLFLSSLRILAALVTPDNPAAPARWRLMEKPYEYVPIIILIVILVFLGLFPHVVLGGITDALTTFTQLQ